MTRPYSAAFKRKMVERLTGEYGTETDLLAVLADALASRNGDGPVVERVLELADAATGPS